MHIHRNPGLQLYWARRVEWMSVVTADGSGNIRDPWSVSVEEQLLLLQSESADTK